MSESIKCILVAVVMAYVCACVAATTSILVSMAYANHQCRKLNDTFDCDWVNQSAWVPAKEVPAEVGE